jgi:hypothetical protein
VSEAIAFFEPKIRYGFIKPPQSGEKMHKVFACVRAETRRWYAKFPTVLEVTGCLLAGFSNPAD